MGLCSLVQRNKFGTYEIRKRVPADLQVILGQKTIKKSLGTNTPNEAKRRKAPIEAEIMELFIAKRAELAGTSYTPASCPALAASTALSSLVQSNATAKGINLTIQAVFDKWAESKRRSTKNAGSADVSVGRNQQKLDAFLASQGNLLIGSITVDHLIAFRDHLKQTTQHKGKTINNYLKSIHATVSFAVNERYINIHPLKGIKYLLSEDDSEKWISPQ